jgi:putative transposase
MGRQIRIEYPGAIYHIMARGDRKEPIVHDDADRRTFLRTLEEMCDRTGIRVYAYALLNNHYHFVLTTPEGNLVKGISWFQNTYTHRFNTRHKLWGHLFGSRYKAILIEPAGNYFRRVVDYVHLNPVRAGLISPANELGHYPWGSLKLLLSSPESRPPWLDTVGLFRAFGLEDTAGGRNAYRERLEQIIPREGPEKAGRVDRETTPAQTLQATIRRGWYFGSENFKEQMLDRLDVSPDRSRRRGADGYRGQQMRDHSELMAREIIQEGCRFFRIQLDELRSRKKNNIDKILLAEIIASHTSVTLDWLRNELSLGDRSYASRLINQLRRSICQDPRLMRLRSQLLENVNIQ